MICVIAQLQYIQMPRLKRAALYFIQQSQKLVTLSYHTEF